MLVYVYAKLVMLVAYYRLKQKMSMDKSFFPFFG